MASNTQALTLYNEPGPAATPAERLARGGGWWTLMLALLVLFAMTEALSTAAWSEGLEVVRLTVFGGALLAFVLSLSRWDGFFPIFYGGVISVAWLTVLFKQLLFADLPAQEAFAELIQRNVNWIAALIGGSASADNLIFITQLGLLGWWIGYLAIWSLMRHQRVLLAVLPAGVALVVNTYYATEELTGFLIVYLGAVLLLAIRVELARNEARWQVTRVRYPPDIVLDFLKAGLVFTVVVIFAAWAVPDIAEDVNVERLLRPFEEPWQRVEDTWNRMYQSVNSRRAPVATTNFGRTMTLGGPVNLTDRPVFQASGLEATYWRAAAYDTYNGASWLNTDTETAIIERNESLREPTILATRLITYTVWPLESSQTTIIAPPQPLRISVPVNADATLLTDDPVTRVVSTMRSRVDLEREGAYRVLSAFSAAPVDTLRVDTTVYPAWVKQRYLQLPDSVTSRVRELALNTTADHDNPYDKAAAIEALLRTYTYNQQIAAPPAGADAVDYFLFESREGYCDYFASAMVVMLRSVGIPARLVAGYTPGEVVPKQEQDLSVLNTYLILERNAHSWPEVYFPSFGWIQFEPTASEPLRARPTPAPATPSGPGDQSDNSSSRFDDDDPIPDDFGFDDSTSFEPRSRFVRWLGNNWGWLAAVALLGLVGGAGWHRFRRQQVAFFQDRAVLARLFGLLGAWAGRLGVPWLASATPLERAAEFDRQIPAAAPTVDNIASLFVAQQYGRQDPAPEDLTGVAEGWQILRPKLLREWLRGKALRLVPKWLSAAKNQQPTE